MLHTLKQKTHEVNTEIYTLYLSYRDHRVKWYVRLLLAFAIAYAISPVDFVLDSTAIFGFLDDVVIVAGCLHLSYRLLAKDILDQARLQAYEELNSLAESATAYKVIGYTWLLAFTALALVVYKLLNMSLL
ncbi:MAG: DUF1232 domain-containing protein [Hymenobacteraceae bacterium]|nr:DUF1232 domain-containing protein [Hymenobacteraceae bacterium]